jgi:lipid A 4'-phosphatase
MTVSASSSDAKPKAQLNKWAYLALIKRQSLWLVPILMMLIITPFTPYLDLCVAKFTYVNETIQEGGKLSGFFSNSFFDFLYLYGVLPAQITCGGATCLLFFSLFFDALKKWRSPALVLSLTLAIGSGFIAHSILKEFWVRPRPRQVVQFGGKQLFCPYYKPLAYKTTQTCKSMPSGHSTTGFYFFALYFLGRRLQRPQLATVGLMVSLSLGGLLSLARIVQGGHFVSDVFVSALIMWLSAYFIDYLVFETTCFRKFCQHDCCESELIS